MPLRHEKPATQEVDRDSAQYLEATESSVSLSEISNFIDSTGALHHLSTEDQQKWYESLASGEIDSTLIRDVHSEHDPLEEDRSLVAGAFYRHYPEEKKTTLDVLTVSPSDRGRGLGRSLAGSVEVSARQANSNQIESSIPAGDKDAQRFLQSQGYRFSYAKSGDIFSIQDRDSGTAVVTMIYIKSLSD